MININLLKSEIAKNGFNHRTLCKEINMPESTFSRRLKKGVFKSNEVEKLIKVLKLKKPMEIFFSKN